MCSICTQVKFLHLSAFLHPLTCIYALPCVHSQKIHLGFKFNLLHLESKGKFVPECILAPGCIFLKHCSHGKKKKTPGANLHLDAKYTQVQVLHMNMYFDQSDTSKQLIRVSTILAKH